MTTAPAPAPAPAPSRGRQAFEAAKPALVTVLLVVLTAGVTLVLAQSAGLIHWSALGGI
jgi:hypothetical protein